MNVSEMFDQIIRTTISGILSDIKDMLLIYWPWLLKGVLFILGGVFLQILMFKIGSGHKLSSSFNRLVGGLTYGAFFIILLSVNYWLFGTQVINEIWFLFFGIISFLFAGIFLRAIGFWRY